MELRYGIHEAEGIERFGKPDPHTVMVTMVMSTIVTGRMCQFGHDVINFIISF